MQTILTSRVAVLGAGAACLLVANGQTGSVIEDDYKDQAGMLLLYVDWDLLCICLVMLCISYVMLYYTDGEESGCWILP